MVGELGFGHHLPERVGLFTRPSVGVVVQSLLDPDAAGVMFTENPVTGADERVIEASLGLGEAVVAGLVIPDTYRVDCTGEVLERAPGLKRVAIRSLPDGGTFEEQVPTELTEKLCLDDDQLAALHELANRCDAVYGKARDIEFAFADGTLYLLQCRAVTTSSSSAVVPAPEVAVGDPAAALQAVPLFAALDDDEVEQIARAVKGADVRGRRDRDPGRLRRRRVLPHRLGRGHGVDPRGRSGAPCGPVTTSERSR